MVKPSWRGFTKVVEFDGLVRNLKILFMAKKSKSKTKLKTVYFHYYCGEHGENQGMFEENGKLIHAWSCNDADWRDEYFTPLATYFGYVVKDLPDNMLKDGEKAIVESFGGKYDPENP